MHVLIEKILKKNKLKLNDPTKDLMTPHIWTKPKMC